MAEKRRKLGLGRRLLYHIGRHENDAAISMLNSDLVEVCDDKRGTLLLYAVRLRNAVIVRHLINLGSEVDRLGGRHDESPLMIAADVDNSEIVKILLEANANIELTNAKGESPLKKAFNVRCRVSSSIVFQLFLRTLKNETSNTEDLLKKLIAVGCDSLYKAATLEDVQILEWMLKQGFEINSKDPREGKTALHAAAKLNNVQLAEWLIAKGADVNATDNQGNDALFFAVHYANKAMMQLLLKHGVNLNVIYANNSLSTPLFQAVCDRNNADKENECLEILLQSGVILENISTTSRLTLFDYAFRRGNPIRVHYLIAHLAILERMGIIHHGESTMICNIPSFKVALANLAKYHEECQQLLEIRMFRSSSLFDLLNYNNFNTIRLCARYKSFVSDLEKICMKHELAIKHIYYYKTLMKRMEQATDLVKLEDQAIPVICRIFGANQSKCYIAARIIVGYLSGRELERLCEAFKEKL